MIDLNTNKRCLMVAAGGMLNESGYAIRVWMALRAIKQVQEGKADKPALVTFESPRAVATPTLTARLAERAAAVGVELFIKTLLPKKLPRQDVFNRVIAGRVVRKLVRELDVGVVHGQSHVGADFAHAAGRLHNRPVTVFDVHGVDIEERLGDGRLKSRSARHKRAESRELAVWRDSTHRLVVSKSLGDFMNDKHQLASNFSVVPCLNSLPNGCGDIEKDRVNARTFLGYGGGEKVLLYLGGASEWQQPQLIINTFRELHGLDCSWRLLVLTGDQGLFRHLAESAMLPASVVKVLSVSHREVKAYASAADLGVLLRKDNIINRVASPTKFGEYLYMGLPVLLTDGLPDFAQIVSQNRIGIEVSANAAAKQIARQVVDFFQGPSLKGPALRKFCYEVGHKHLSFESVLSLYHDIYGP